MAVTTQAELLLALERGQFDLVINTAESDWIDFKEASYQLQQPHQKWELAKDVAAFANGQGGVIIWAIARDGRRTHWLTWPRSIGQFPRL